jgi:hypothetical protein
MVKKDHILQLINASLNQILLVAESSLHPNQFQAFRKLTLDAFGKNGLGKELDRIFEDNHKKPGKDRAGIY